MDWNEYIGGVNNTILEYIKDTKGNKVGVLLATVCYEKVCFGWSLCNKKDNFDALFGIDIAADRAFKNDRYKKNLKYSDDYPINIEFIDDILPVTVVKNLPKFLNRVLKYYKNNILSELLEYILGSFCM